METLGGFLKGLRERVDLSQEAVSAKAELSETYYGKIEGDKRRPDALTLLRVLAVLDATQAEKYAALRLFMSTRFPETVVVQLQAALSARPQKGPAALSVVPSRKRARPGRQKLAAWAFAVASASALGQPLGLLHEGPITMSGRGILSRSRRWLAPRVA